VFLKRLRALGKRLVLLTNSHPQVLKIKDEQTGVTGYLDVAISSHVFQVPKGATHALHGWPARDTLDRR